MTDKQHIALDFMIMGKSPSEVAAAVGVCRETVWRWTKDPDFAAALADARTERRERLQVAIEDAAVRAAEVLAAGLDDSVPWNVRIRVAESILDRAGSKR